MIDIQNQADTRDVPLQKVGVKGLRYPVQVLDKTFKTQQTSGVVDLFVNLPRHFKGTHMSRFIEIFHKYHKNVSMKQFLAMLDEIRRRLDAECAFGTLAFPFFMEKQAPVSRQPGMMSYECTYEGIVSAENSRFYVSVAVPVATLCPCSKAISTRGAHNQRGIVRVTLQSTVFFWIEDIIAVVEQAASAGLYSVLKRSDEKFVTEQAYDNPRFVEDVVREVYIALRNFRCGGDAVRHEAGKGAEISGDTLSVPATGAGVPFRWFSVEAENFESIHNHNAYAYTEYSGQE